MMIDTDVFIWYLKGNEKTKKIIEDNSEKIYISVISYMELVQGMRNKNELNALKKLFFNCEIDIIYLSESISAKALFFVEQYFLSHSMELADALIGASAVSCAQTLLTGNDKHYKPLRNIQLKKFRP